MTEWAGLGKVFLVLGLLLALVGGLLIAADKLPGVGNFFGWFGKLPGDIAIRRDNFSFYFPIATGLVISLVLTLLLSFFGWVFRR
jgi:hypothetical protein